MKSDTFHFNTLTIHGGQEIDSSYGAVMPPIYQTSTYAQSRPGNHKGYEYSRTHNPTRTALEKALASLEGGNFGLAFSSGLAAIDAVIKLLKPGDEVIATNDLYGGSYRLFSKVFAPYGIQFHFIDMTDEEEIKNVISSKTKLIWIETPTNPLLKIIDIKLIANLIKGKDILLAVDNTFASPYLQKPLELGADIVMHSATKYLAGHSDVILGALIVENKGLYEQLAFMQNACGGVPGPQDSFLVLRGIKTLHLRMQRHCENASYLAEFLKSHPKVEQVFYPGLTSHTTHETAKRQMKDYGGMISFIPKDHSLETAYRIMEKLKLFTIAESLGGVESLAGHPASMTHASIPREERIKAGLEDSLIRLSVGIEDVRDLEHDLEFALKAG